jgi:dihydrofolate reductase
VTRKVIVSEFLTLDGVMQSPGHPDEDRSGGFEQGGWQTPYFDQEMGASLFETMQASDALLLGRKTYEIFASFWPHQPNNDPVAIAMNGFRKYVASTTLQEPLSWQNSSVIKGDVSEAVTGLKGGDGRGIQVVGSGALVQTLIKHDLVDEYRLLVHPVVVGEGKRLFNRAVPTPLKLQSATTTTAGVVVLAYEA